MLVSLQRRVTLLPPLNEFLELPECFFRCDVPLVGRADLFKFFHDLFLAPWLDFTRNVPFQMDGTRLQIHFWESIGQGCFQCRVTRHIPAGPLLLPLFLWGLQRHLSNWSRFRWGSLPRLKLPVSGLLSPLKPCSRLRCSRTHPTGWGHKWHRYKEWGNASQVYAPATRLHLHVPCSRDDLPDFYCNACRKTARKFTHLFRG